MSGADGPLLDVHDLRVTFRVGRQGVDAVRGVSFTVAAGECVALVGESGSGKSATARALLGLAGPAADVRAERLVVAGRDAIGFTERDWRRLRGRRVGLVNQDALVSLDPLRTVGREIGEPLRVHRVVPRAGVEARVVELLGEVAVPEPEQRARQRPGELSGGLRQRALIASALAAEPSLIVADEPTTALDVTVQARVLDLLDGLRRAGRGLLVISHDLAVVGRLADRVVVLKAGQVVESGPVATLLRGPSHPHTRELVAAATGRPRPGARPRPAPTGATGPVVMADGVGKRFPRPGGGVRDAVADVTLRVAPGEIVGLVGGSGSGKTTLARIVLGRLEPDAGTVRLDGAPWSGQPERRRRPRRAAIQMIYQDPLSSFDPRYPVEDIVGEAARAAGVPRPGRRDAVLARLAEVGLGPEHLHRRPGQLSGGQRQRVAIARALAVEPRVLLCDEPVSALDATVRERILDLLLDLRERRGMAMLFVSHDLGVVRRVCDRVLVMRDGRVVEEGAAEDVFTRPRSPYTRDLLAAVPRLDGTRLEGTRLEGTGAGGTGASVTPAARSASGVPASG